jgi:hypothetical protein
MRSLWWVGQVMRRAFIVSGFFVFCYSAAANSAEYDMMGLGLQTCGTFAEAYRKSPEIAEGGYFFWAQGYMSGLNLGNLAHGGIAKNLASVPIKDEQHALRKYCDEHPLAQYQKAVLELFISLPAMSPREPTHQ